MIYTVNYFNPVGNCDNIAYNEGSSLKAGISSRRLL